MENIDVLGKAIKILPTFCEYITPTAKKSGLSPEAALCLLILSEYSQYEDFYITLINHSSAELVEKNCIKAENGKYILTPKGAIVAKSVNSAKERFSD